jgi:hypothetical protein
MKVSFVVTFSERLRFCCFFALYFAVISRKRKKRGRGTVESVCKKGDVEKLAMSKREGLDRDKWKKFGSGAA